MPKPKILHIGGSHSVHVADWVNLLDSEGYEQCIFSYRNERKLIPKHIPVVGYNYGAFFPNKNLPRQEKSLKNVLLDFVRREKPDIVHAHFLIMACVPINVLYEEIKLPLFISTWSRRIFLPYRVLYDRVQKAFKHCSCMVMSAPTFYEDIKTNYDIKHIKYLDINPPIDLSNFHDEQKKDITVPKILSARVMGQSYHQELLIRALPALFLKHPNSKVTLIIGQHASQGRTYFNRMVLLAKTLGVYEKCSFIDRGLSQKEFSDLIAQHNIVYSVAEDPGISQTTVQSAYSGAITIVQNYPAEIMLLKNNENVLRTTLNNVSVRNILLYAADNLQKLQPIMYHNNRFLGGRSTEKVLPILMSAYNEEFNKGLLNE